MNPQNHSNKDSIYLNWGTLSKTWPGVMNKMHQYQLEYEVNPTVSLFEGWGRLWETQKKVATFFRAKPTDFYFRHNVTVAMNDFILGAELPAGDLVVTDLEYGAITNICRYRAEKDNRKLTTISIPIGDDIKSEEHLVDLIMNQLPAKTALLMISHVMTGTGLKVPLSKLAQRTRQRGVLLAVDGAHGPGALELDFEKLQDVDFYGGNLHKWFRGPKGTGFGWAPERNQSLMKPLLGGWTTFETPIPFLPFGDGHRWNISMLMAYCLNFNPFYALDDTVDEWQGRGPQKTYLELQKKRSFIQKEVSEVLGWKVLSPMVASLQSPLVTFELPVRFASKGFEIIHELRKQKNVTVSITPLKGSYALRLSAHIDVSEDEIVEGVARIKDYFNS